MMVIAAPLLARLRFGPRLAATLGVLAMFALVTRAEPSVLRATAMASVAAAGAALGRPTSTVRTLALGVSGMLLVDPLLATSLGFQLSVAGAAGIVVGAARIEDMLPGPRWLAAPLSVTLAAQAAVSPLLVATFDAVPLASLPANLLAAPAAGPLMVWGLTGGLVAGVVGGPLAHVIHLPTRALLVWLEGVATAAVRWPLGDLSAGHLAALGVATLLLVSGRGLSRAGRSTVGGAPRRTPDRGDARGGRGAAGVGFALRVAGGGLAVVVVLATVAPIGDATPVRLDHAIGLGATLWRSGGAAVVVLDGRARDGVVLTALRREGVERVDVLVLRTNARAGVDVVATLQRRWPDAAVLAPLPQGAVPGDRLAEVDGGVGPPTGTVFDIGGLRVTVASNTAGRLDVRIAPRAPPEGALGARILGDRGRLLVAARAAHRRDPDRRWQRHRPGGPRAGGRCRARPTVRA